MSVWTEVSGTVTVPKSSRFGIKELINTHFGWAEAIPFVEEIKETTSTRIFGVKFNFSNDGFSAAKNIEDFMEELYSNMIQADLNASIRFMV